MQLEKNGSKITKVSFKKDQVVITFDDDTKLELASDTFTHFYLYEGKTLDKNDIKEIKEIDALSSLKRYALNLISRKMYTEYEIKNKLYQKKCSKKNLEKIISYLKENNFINDQKYLDILLEEYSLKNYGEKKIIHALELKGFDDKLIKSLYFDEDEEFDKAKIKFEEYLQKNKNKSYMRLKSDSYNFLLTNGFRSAIASKTINLIDNYINKEDDDEILLKSLEKYVIMHQVDLEDTTSKEKIIKRFMAKGFSFKDIDKCLKEILWKN